MSCYCLCKDTNSQASHNVFPLHGFGVVVVIAYAKILILKQVTTCVLVPIAIFTLLLPMQ